MWSLIYWHRHLLHCIRQEPLNNLYARLHEHSLSTPIQQAVSIHLCTCLVCLSLALLYHCHLICLVINHLSPRPFFSHSATDSSFPIICSQNCFPTTIQISKITLYKLLMTSYFLKDQIWVHFHGIQLAPGYLSYPGYLSLCGNIQSCASASSTTTEYFTVSKPFHALKLCLCCFSFSA